MRLRFSMAWLLDVLLLAPFGYVTRQRFTRPTLKLWPLHAVSALHESVDLRDAVLVRNSYIAPRLYAR
jgi:hypothetical protein